MSRRRLREPAEPPGPSPVARWFLRRGVPTLLDGTIVGRNVTGRMAPALVVLYVLSLTPFAQSGTWSLGWDLLFAVLSVVLTWMLSNLVRGRRPFTPAVTLGVVELGLFLVVPSVAFAVVTAVDGGPGAVGVANHIDWPDVLIAGLFALLLQAVLLVITWALVHFGVAALGIWLSRQIIGSLNDVGVAIARTLPLLLGVVTFFFFTAEVWQSVGRVATAGYVGVVGLFIAVSAVFLGSRWQLDLAALARFDTAEQVADCLRAGGVPMLRAPALRYPAQCPLSAGQRRHLRLVASLSKLTVATLVGLAIFAFFVVLGFLGISASTVQAWVSGQPRLLVTASVGVHEFALTWEHLKVAGFLAVFTGFYFAVVSATDASLREGLRDTAEDAVRQACAARLSLLHTSIGHSVGADPQADTAVL